MHVSNVRPLFGLITLFVLVSLACSSVTTLPTEPASTDSQNQVEALASPEPNNTPESSNTPVPPTDEAALPTIDSSSEQPVFGYIDSSPTIFIQPASGLSVEISDAIYSPETGGLESYKAIVKYPAGDFIDLEFHDIAFNTSTGSVDAYEVLLDGKNLQGPTIEEFESHRSELGSVLAFSLNSFAGTEPLPMVSVPCQGDSNVEYGQFEEWRQVVRHVITCSDQTYTLQYSGYSYDNQLGTLAGYSVLVEITP